MRLFIPALCSLALVVLPLVSFAQTLYPYSCQDGTYGLANETGQLIEDCQYTAFRPALSQPYHIFQGDEGHVVYAFSGERCPFPFDRQPTIQLIRYRDKGQEDLVDSIYVLYTSTLTVLHHPRQPDRFWRSLSREQAGFAEQRYLTDSYQPVSPAFYYGMTKIHPAPGVTNFLHRDGYLVLEADIENGKIVDAGLYAKRHNNGLFSLNSYYGKQYTEARYQNILAAPRPGYYVANMPAHFIPQKDYPDKALLLDAEGKIILDTLHEVLMPIDDTYLIAGRKGAAGVIRYDGTVAVPLEYETLKPALPGHLIAIKERGWYLIDYEGNPVGDGQAYQRLLSTNRKAYFGRTATHADLIDENGEIFYTDNCDIQFHLPKLNYFVLRQGRLQGLVDNRGELLIPYSHSKIMAVAKGQWFLCQDEASKRYGLRDETGKLMLPYHYTDIQVRPYQEEDNYISWAQAEGETLYYAYDRAGQRLNIPPRLSPGSGGNPYFRVKQSSDGYNYTLPGGRVIEDAPYKVVKSVVGPDQLPIHQVQQGEDYYLLDHEFYNLIPEGFRILRRFKDDRHLGYGLVPVYDEFRSGVINLRGEWVVEPGPYGYSVLNTTLIRRHQGQPRGVSGPGGLDLLVVEDGKIHSETHYDWIDDKLVRGSLVVGKLSGDRTLLSTYKGLVDTFGQVVLPLQFQTIKVREDRITTLRPIDADTKEVGMHQLDGEVIFTMPGDNLVYHPDQERCILTVAGQTGLLSKDGEILLAPQFKSLSFLGDLLQYQDADGQYILANEQGTVHYRGEQALTRGRNWRKGYRRVFTNKDGMLLFNQDMELLVSYPYRPATTRAYAPHLLYCKSMDRRRTIFVNLETGVAYGD